MEANSRPPASLDLAAVESGRNELSPTNSDSSSITVDNSKDFIHRNTNARPCMAWTDEKHHSYLATLEASFVKQLHHSFGLLSWHSEQNTCDPSPSRQLPVNSSYSSDQFAVLKDGLRQKINLERNQPLVYGIAGSHFGRARPWIGDFRCSGKHSTIISANLRGCSTVCSEEMLSRGKRNFSHRLSSLGQHCVCHKCQQDAGSICEVSDQNFVDEDREKASSLSRVKRLKMAAADPPTKDHEVPSWNRFTAEISTVTSSSSERGEQVRHERLSEKIESFVCAGPEFIKRELEAQLQI